MIGVVILLAAQATELPHNVTATVLPYMNCIESRMRADERRSGADAKLQRTIHEDSLRACAEVRRVGLRTAEAALSDGTRSGSAKRYGVSAEQLFDSVDQGFELLNVSIFSDEPK